MPFKRTKKQHKDTHEEVYQEIEENTKKTGRLIRIFSKKKPKDPKKPVDRQTLQTGQDKAQTAARVKPSSTAGQSDGIEYEDLESIQTEPSCGQAEQHIATRVTPKSDVPSRPPREPLRPLTPLKEDLSMGKAGWDNHSNVHSYDETQCTPQGRGDVDSASDTDGQSGDSEHLTESVPTVPPKTELIDRDSSSRLSVPLPEVPSVPKSCIDGASVLPSLFDRPWGICVSPTNGNIYITDSDRSQIMQFDHEGQLMLTIGAPGTQNGEFNEPRGIALSTRGRIVVCDSKNNRIQVLEPDGSFVRKFGCQGNIEAQLVRPFGVAVSKSNIVYIAEQGHNRVQMRTIEGGFLRAFGSEGPGQGQLKRPHDLALTGNGKVVVADTGNHRLQVFSPDGVFEYSLGHEGRAPGEFLSPKSVTARQDGNLIVADDHNNRVQVLTSSGQFLYALGGTRRGAEEGEFDQPTGVAVNGCDTIYVCDHCNRRIQVF